MGIAGGKAARNPSFSLTLDATFGELLGLRN